jgi:hypothetical protein
LARHRIGRDGCVAAPASLTGSASIRFMRLRNGLCMFDDRRSKASAPTVVVHW